MSNDPIIYDAVKHKHPSLCSACITRQGDAVQMLSGYCVTASRCDGCGRTADLAMCVISKPLVKLEQDSRTGTQNRPYPPGTLMVRATLTVRGVPSVWEFNWNDRDSVRRFAADSDRCIRAGGTTTLEPVKNWERCPSCDGRCVEDTHKIGDGDGGPCRTCGGTGTIKKGT